MKEAHEGKGGPAFPFTMDAGPDGNVGYFGMSLRDYFAAKAMESLLLAVAQAGESSAIEPIPHAAYQMADAMLKARNE